MPFVPLGPLQPQGVNPRGLKPNSRWQMDVTHVPSFGRLKYVHVIIDTFSAMCYAVPLAGETAKHCVKALRQGILFMGVPWDIKTDNGPAYRSASFAAFLRLYNITHHFGIPYNPQGKPSLKVSTAN